MTKNNNSIIVSIIIGISVIISILLAANSFKDIKQSKTIFVTGSAQKEITSDFGTWTGKFSVSSTDGSYTDAKGNKYNLSLEKSRKTAYTDLLKNKEEIITYFASLGIKKDDLIFSSVKTEPIYKRNYNGYRTETILGYTLFQNVSIESNDVTLIDNVSKKATDLISKGLSFESYDPEYYCTKLAEVKLEMIGAATKNCKQRAQQIVENTDAKLGNIISSRTGVFQITPANSTNISDYGINDTSSIKKQITSVVKCEFNVN